MSEKTQIKQSITLTFRCCCEDHATKVINTSCDPDIVQDVNLESNIPISMLNKEEIERLNQLSTQTIFKVKFTFVKVMSFDKVINFGYDFGITLAMLSDTIKVDRVFDEVKTSKPTMFNPPTAKA